MMAMRRCLTDLYELTMLESYFAHGMNDIAVFDLFVRRLPKTRNYLVGCGLEDVLHYLETLSFSTEHLSYLKSLNRFSGTFIDSLGRLHFTGDVYAVPEGTVVFANEPIVEIVAPLQFGVLRPIPNLLRLSQRNGPCVCSQKGTLCRI